MKDKTRKNIKIVLAIIIFGLIALPMLNYAMSNLGFPDHSETDEEQNPIEEAIEKEKVEIVENQAGESFVLATIIDDTPYYNNYSKNRDQVGDFVRGETVEIIRDRIYEWYLVKSRDGREGWVSSQVLAIPEDPETNDKRMTKEEIENFIDEKKFTSNTDYLVWVDIDRQLTHVLLKDRGNWKLHKTMLSATGSNISPTIKGIFKIQDRGESFYNDKLKNGAKNWVRFEGVYLFHSIVTDKRGNVIDDTLGKRASDGCVRLSLEDSQWFYQNIEEDSTVFIN